MHQCSAHIIMPLNSQMYKCGCSLASKSSSSSSSGSSRPVTMMANMIKEGGKVERSHKSLIFHSLEFIFNLI